MSQASSTLSVALGKGLAVFTYEDANGKTITTIGTRNNDFIPTKYASEAGEAFQLLDDIVKEYKKSEKEMDKLHEIGLWFNNHFKTKSQSILAFLERKAILRGEPNWKSNEITYYDLVKRGWRNVPDDKVVNTWRLPCSIF